MRRDVTGSLLVKNVASRGFATCFPALVVGVFVSSLAWGTTAIGEEREDSFQALAEDASLEDYLRIAALNNAGLESTFNLWKASLERIPQAKSLPDPRFNYTYFVEEVETRVGPQRQRFGVAQMFPWFGKLRLRGDAAAASAEAAQQDYEKAKLALFYRVKAAYYEYWYLAQAIAVTEEHTRLVSNMEAVARTRFTAGTAPHSAVIQAQVELGKLDDRLRTLVLMREPVVAKLNAAMTRPTYLMLPWPQSLPEIQTTISDAEVKQRLVENNPDLQRLEHLVAREESGIRLARRNYYPDISLGADYVQTDEALMPNTLDSGKDPIMAMISINVPIWQGSYRAAEREAHLKKAAVVNSLEDAGKRLEADLEFALYQFRDAKRKIDLYSDTLIPKAEQSLAVVQQGFEAGKTDFIALIDAERLLLEFQLAGRRAQADLGQRLAEIEMLTGNEAGENHGQDEKTIKDKAEEQTEHKGPGGS